VVNGFSTHLKLSKVRILPKAADQAKKATLKGTLLCQVHVQGEYCHWSLRHYRMILHQTTLSGREPNKACLHHPSQFDGIQLVKKQSKEFQLPIMRRSYKINIPLKRATRELKIICHRGILKAGNAK
jgi:hypothetical protein